MRSSCKEKSRKKRLNKADSRKSARTCRQYQSLKMGSSASRNSERKRRSEAGEGSGAWSSIDTLRKRVAGANNASREFPHPQTGQTMRFYVVIAKPRADSTFLASRGDTTDPTSGQTINPETKTLRISSMHILDDHFAAASRASPKPSPAATAPSHFGAAKSVRGQESEDQASEACKQDDSSGDGSRQETDPIDASSSRTIAACRPAEDHSEAQRKPSTGDKDIHPDRLPPEPAPQLTRNVVASGAVESTHQRGPVARPPRLRPKLPKEPFVEFMRRKRRALIEREGRAVVVVNFIPSDESKAESLAQTQSGLTCNQYPSLSHDRVLEPEEFETLAKWMIGEGERHTVEVDTKQAVRSAAESKNDQEKPKFDVESKQQTRDDFEVIESTLVPCVCADPHDSELLACGHHVCRVCRHPRDAPTSACNVCQGHIKGGAESDGWVLDGPIMANKVWGFVIEKYRFSARYALEHAIVCGPSTRQPVAQTE